MIGTFPSANSCNTLARVLERVPSVLEHKHCETSKIQSRRQFVPFDKTPVHIVAARNWPLDRLFYAKSTTSDGSLAFAKVHQFTRSSFVSSLIDRRKQTQNGFRRGDSIRSRDRSGGRSSTSHVTLYFGHWGGWGLNGCVS